MGWKNGSAKSNLKCFLDSMTPVVQSQFLSKSEITNLNNVWDLWERETVEYFTLGDLWSCYDEWSAYGAGVPVILNSGETVVQYYVPYLSAIQIFTSNTPVTSSGEETEAGDSEMRDSFSDFLSDESESEKLWRWDGGSFEDFGLEQETNMCHFNDKLGYLSFQYFERSPPFGRIPLMDKINSLAQRYPKLMSLKSVHLSPASWMAVSWYISFSLAILLEFQSVDMDPYEVMGITEKKNNEENIALPPFGLATYKMQGNLWFSDENGRDQERVITLLSAADSWLKQLRVQHHDFDYFTRIQHS
ncbi:hypothetical protein GIB67_028407 [Kingdonia uniflora]|uniref:Uncharacterized protein n=1 Tax=Kingdonia uniflora TaxID=39325 RepID=A0A7J7MHW7_9MAGN|nr:hypothetical protein GIB67_028407 [Kingdonia uniflora]